MKKVYVIACLALIGMGALAQNENPDTTRINLGETEVLIIKTKKGTIMVEGDSEKIDTIDASGNDDKPRRKYSNDGNWSGIDFGVSMLTNAAMQTSFPNDPQWENDPARSFYWNFNISDHRFNIYKEYIGITTGLGFNLTQVGFKNNYLLQENKDSLWVITDTLTSYRRNKLRGTYLQIPLLLEFNTSSKQSKSFHLSAGVVGGLRLASSLRRRTNESGSDSKEKIKGTHGLNPFRLDATVRAGYADWGIFANYSLMPLFDTNKTAEVYPLSFGITYSF
jgi:hypothetical protein